MKITSLFSLFSGCAFITFSSRQSAQNCIKNMHHSQTMEVSLRNKKKHKFKTTCFWQNWTFRNSFNTIFTQRVAVYWRKKNMSLTRECWETLPVSQCDRHKAKRCVMIMKGRNLKLKIFSRNNLHLGLSDSINALLILCWLSYTSILNLQVLHCSHLAVKKIF